MEYQIWACDIPSTGVALRSSLSNFTEGSSDVPKPYFVQAESLAKITQLRGESMVVFPRSFRASLEVLERVKRGQCHETWLNRYRRPCYLKRESGKASAKMHVGT